jgi:DNA-binding transcriptional regulator of glucitol operon
MRTRGRDVALGLVGLMLLSALGWWAWNRYNFKQ